jgi:hypothetical protein
MRTDQLRIGHGQFSCDLRGAITLLVYQNGAAVCQRDQGNFARIGKRCVDGLVVSARDWYDARKEAAMLPLTDEQVQALESHTGPFKLVNPRTQEVFVLVRQDVFKLTSAIISGPNRRGWDDPEDDDLIKEDA